MKKILSLVFVLISFVVSAQSPNGTPITGIDVPTHSYRVYIYNSINNNPVTAKNMEQYFDSTSKHTFYKKYYLDSLRFVFGNPDRVVTIDTVTGQLYTTRFTSLKVDWANVQNKPTIGTGTVTSVGLTSSTLTVSGTVTISGNITVNLPNTGTASTYGQVTTDAQGRVTSGKRVEVYSGTTSGSGTYTVSFSSSYSVAPNIQANIINGTDTQNIRITSITTTGFTVLVRNRTDVIGLLPSYSNVSGANVDVLITEK